MKKFYLIVNPEAGRKQGEKAIPQLREWLSNNSLDWPLFVTSKPGDASDFACEKAGEDTTLIAVGGDGTINEVVNGARGKAGSLGIIPVGSGNDFVKNLNIPTDLNKALAILLNGKRLNIDIGEINGRLFINSIAMGIDGAVAEDMNNATALPPKLAYHYGVLKNVFLFRNKTIRWKTGEKAGEYRVNLASVMNGHTYGGSYQVAPQASVTDGYLDFVVVGDYKILGRILHLPKLKTGKHLPLKKVTSLRFKELTIESNEYIPVAIDGELVIDSRTPIDFDIRVIPGGLRVISGLT